LVANGPHPARTGGCQLKFIVEVHCELWSANQALSSVWPSEGGSAAVIPSVICIDHSQQIPCYCSAKIDVFTAPPVVPPSITGRL